MLALIALVVNGALAPAVAAEEAGDDNQSQAEAAPPRLSLYRTSIDSDSPLSVNEPMYFLVGGDETKARFQLSFKYRIFDPGGTVANKAPWLRHLHFGYTQTSLWNISEESSPFEDSSFRPSLFWDLEGTEAGLMPDFWRWGYEHVSNGRSGIDSRGIDTLFLRPAWRWRWAGRDFIVAPRAFVYLWKDEPNDNIEAFRGHADLRLRYGRADGIVADALWRRGRAGKHAVQLDFSYPLRRPRPDRIGGFLHLQAFYGYGETLLSFDQKRDLQIRIGFSIVR